MKFSHEKIFDMAGRIATKRVFDPQLRPDRQMDMYVAGVLIHRRHPDISENALALAMYRRGVQDVVQKESAYFPVHAPLSDLEWVAGTNFDWESVEARVVLEEGLRSIPRKHALPLVMQGLDFTLHEIGEEMGCTRQAASSHAVRGRKEIAPLIAGVA